MKKWTPRIYLAVPVAGGREDAPVYPELAKALEAVGEVLPDAPQAADLTPRGEERAASDIHHTELARLASADALVAEVTVHSFGVGYLVAHALAWEKPVMCLYRPGRPISALLLGDERILTHSYTTMHELEYAVSEFLTLNL